MRIIVFLFGLLCWIGLFFLNANTAMANIRETISVQGKIVNEDGNDKYNSDVFPYLLKPEQLGNNCVTRQHGPVSECIFACYPVSHKGKQFVLVAAVPCHE